MVLLLREKQPLPESTSGNDSGFNGVKIEKGR